MSTTPAFSTQVIGQTENALGALMNRVLARTGVPSSHNQQRLCRTTRRRTDLASAQKSKL